ncbi:MAG: hypothetical protein ACON5A_01610 [Candidatus Comchoanobacterales bacterium]
MIKKLGMLLMLVSSLMLSAEEKLSYWSCSTNNCEMYYQCPATIVGVNAHQRYYDPSPCLKKEEHWQMTLENAKKKADDLKKENVVWFSLKGCLYYCKNLGTPIAKKLAEVLKENGMLTHLDLTSHNIGDDGAIALAEALKENSTLTELVLQYSNIEDKGAMALAEALKEKNRTLTHLDLLNNNIGDKGAMALAEASKKNDTLKVINLKYNLKINKDKFKDYPKLQLSENEKNNENEENNQNDYWNNEDDYWQ